MYATTDRGPLWPTTEAHEAPAATQCVLRLPRWFRLPEGVKPSDVRVELRNGELILVVDR
jgi:hypothetical protein